MEAMYASSNRKLTRTLANQVAEIILQMTMEGKFKPGTRIQEPELARMLNISRVPVREALRILAADGIVVNTPYRGMRIMDVDKKKIIDIRQVRLALENLALDLCMAAPSSLESLIADLKSSVEKMMAAKVLGDLIQLTKEDLEFHRSICRQSGNDVLLSFFDSIANQQMVIFSVIHRDNRYTTIQEDHLKIIRAFETGDDEIAKNALSEHILTAADYILGYDLSIGKDVVQTGR
jgi:DNA-binding GntR family transcriptional regulator